MAITPDTLELDIIRRQSNDYVRGDEGHTSPLSISPIIKQTYFSSSPVKPSNVYGNQEGIDVNNKPWNHHNNLKDTYFTPRKGIKPYSLII